MRLLLVGFSLSFVLACNSGGSGTCNTLNCLGCCNSNGLCESGLTNAACGVEAASCSACTGATTCQTGVCKMINGSGGGIGGGNGVGGGSGGGSGIGGGTGGGSGVGGGTGGGSGVGGGSGGGSGVGGGSGGGSGVGGGSGGGSATDAGLTAEQIMILAARPYRFVVPSGYDGGSAVPLVVLLHGYGNSTNPSPGPLQDAYFQFSALANAKTFLLATPEGTLAPNLYRFWNATDACCDAYSSGVDDVKYLNAVLDDSMIKYRVDPKRVYFVGHSNGGFMSHRMACEKANRIAAIVSLAGMNFKNLTQCQPSAPVAVLQVHGTLDGTIGYDGGTVGGPPFPSARDTVQGWATKNGCTGPLVNITGALDLDSNVAGQETKRAAHTCTVGAAELWTMEGSGHIPGLNANWGPEVWNFLAAHPKP